MTVAMQSFLLAIVCLRLASSYVIYPRRQFAPQQGTRNSHVCRMSIAERNDGTRNYLIELGKQRSRERLMANQESAPKQTASTTSYVEPNSVTIRVADEVNDVMSYGDETSSGSESGTDTLTIKDQTFKREGTTKVPASEQRRVLLFLPGIDGVGTEATAQYDGLSESFDTWKMQITANSRSSFASLADGCIEFLKSIGVTPENKCIIVGTSFGGVLALEIALEASTLVNGVVLVNPATSYTDSPMGVLGNTLALAPEPLFPVAVVGALAGLLTDNSKIEATVTNISKFPLQDRPMKAVEMFGSYFNMVTDILDDITPADLAFRLNSWLKVGAKAVNRRLVDVSVPCLVIAGEEDRMLPSGDEIVRLSKSLPIVETLSFPKVGHAALFDPTYVDLATLIKDSAVYAPKNDPRRARKPQLDPITDFKLDKNSAGYKRGVSSYNDMKARHSPVFFSIDKDGVLRKGVDGVPSIIRTPPGGGSPVPRPILFIGNHQLLALDLPMIVGELLLNNKNGPLLARGLAHPIVMQPETVFARRAAHESTKARQEGTTGKSNTSSTAAVVNRLKDAGLGGLADRLEANTDRLDTASELLTSIREDLQRRQRQSATRPNKKKDRSPSTSSSKNNKSNDDSEDGESAMSRFSPLEQYKALGAVPVSPRSLYKLLKNNDAALLFPGGAREALHGRGEEYQLFWPEKSEFVRMAATFGATIVPYSAIGSADSLAIVAETKDFYDLPIVGESAKNTAASLPSARDVLQQDIPSIPLMVPTLPARHYFLFGKPIETAGMNVNDESTVAEAYKQVKDSVQSGIDYLLRARESDPYKDLVARSAYEAITGNQAPTFSAADLPPPPGVTSVYTSSKK